MTCAGRHRLMVSVKTGSTTTAPNKFPQSSIPPGIRSSPRRPPRLALCVVALRITRRTCWLRRKSLHCPRARISLSNCKHINFTAHRRYLMYQFSRDRLGLLVPRVGLLELKARSLIFIARQHVVHSERDIDCFTNSVRLSVRCRYCV